MSSPQSLSFEAFAAMLAANGHTPDEHKLRSLYAALHTIEALQQHVRQATADMVLEPAHVFRQPAVAAGQGEAQ